VADNILELFFKVDHKELDQAKDKLVQTGREMPTVGQAIENLIGKFRNMPGAVGLAAAAFVGFGLAVKGMVERTLEAQGKLLDLSEALGIPIERAQPFILAMELAGVSAEKLQNSLGKLASSVGDALSDPAGKTAEMFKKLGVSQDELENGDIEQILKATAKGFDEYAEGAAKTAAMRDLLGKQGPQIVNEMRQEAEFEAMAAEALRDYGTAVTETEAQSAKYFGVTLKLGMSMFEGVGASVTRSLLPGLQALVDQFAESGKAGGFMRNVLDGLASTIGVVAKVILTLLVEPVRFVVLQFKMAGEVIGAVAAAIYESLQGNFSNAKSIILDLGSNLKKMASEYAHEAVQFQSALWSSTDAIKEQGKTVEEERPKFEAYSAAAKKVTDTLNQMSAALTAQRSIEAAAAKSLADYRAAQDDVAIATMRAKMAQEGATKADIDRAEALMRATNASKQATADAVAGWNIISKLKAQQIGLLTQETELQKQLAEIAAHPGMTQAQKDEATALANKNAQLRAEQQLRKEIAELDQLVQRSLDKETAALRMGTNQLQLYNQQLRLREQYEKALAKDPAHAKELAAAYRRANKELVEGDRAIQQYKSSFEGFTDGAIKSMQDFAAEATDMNKLGQDLTSTFLNGVTDAFANMGEKGSSAWKELGASLAKFIETAVIKFAVLEVAVLAMKAVGLSNETINAILGAGATSFFDSFKNGKGGGGYGGTNPTCFADGGVVNGPTFFNMGLMGEAGPEAIMPLQRDSAGRLGVSASGDAAGGAVHYHAPNITIVSNQDPEAIARQTKKTLDMHEAMTTRKIAKESRPGGQLTGRNFAFA
jgi:lambda family phage tail tape measure protein